MVEVSRPDKPLFPTGLTKADLATYYQRVAPAMLPLIDGRPLNLERFPDGINGPRIMQQQAGRHFPGWVQRIEVRKRGGSVTHVVAADPGSLVYLAGQACITFHAWLSRRDRLERPDRLIVDLDPSRNDLDEVRRATLTIGTLLRELGLEPWAMASGSRGYHVVIPLQRRLDFVGVRKFARDFAALAAAHAPTVFTIEQRKAKRDGRILIDVMRNGYGHTAVAPYSVRPRPEAPVATPLRWEELGDPRTRPDRWTLRTVLRRLERDGDPWRDIDRHRQTLTAASRRLDDALSEVAER
jgi:bifunctional non-homologous end joining protein LigD